MSGDDRQRLGITGLVFVVLMTAIAPAGADEVWVAPTAQQDFGGLGIGSNVVWPATAFGAVRFAWAVPGDLQTFQSAKVLLIPGSPAGASTVNVFVCPAQNGDIVTAACAGPFTQAFTGVANHLAEVDVSSAVAARIGTPGANYLAVIAYTTPTTTSDHFVGLRFDYAPKIPAGVATLAANTFTGTQTAPAFVGSGAGLTNLPIPAGAATLGANTFAGTQTAPAFVGSGAGLTGVATLGSNTFIGTQSIFNGHLNLQGSSATAGNIFKVGQLFLHDFGTANTFLGTTAGNLTLTGIENAGFGSFAMHSLTSGDDDTGVGENSLFSTTTGSGDTAIGQGTMFFNTTGSDDTAVGFEALAVTNSGAGNTAVGSRALFNSLNDGNTAVGLNAGTNLSSGASNIYLGANVLGLATESNTMYLGKVGTQTKTLIAGVRGITTASATAIPVLIDANGQLGTVSSSVRFKRDIHDMADASHRLFDLRPVTFRYTKPYSDGSQPVQFGLVAEEVAAVFPELAVPDAEGRVETVHYETLNVLLLNEVQHQQRQIDDLKRELSEVRQLLGGYSSDKTR